MVLEATLVCVDNSEYMRNGDFPPSRLDAQQDAVNLLTSCKVQQNPENTVGILTTAGKNAQILVTQTQDPGKILAALHSIKVGGTCNWPAAIQKAQLALKHRSNPHQKARIIVFAASPVECSEDELVQLAKRLKKNSVSVDVINFGEELENTPKWEAFISAVNANDTSHLLTVPAGPHILSDILITSDIINESGGSGQPGSGAVGDASSDFPFGVDPAVDPELAMALRISMEEERARQEAAKKASGKSAKEGGLQSEKTPLLDTEGAYDDDENLYGTKQNDTMDVDTKGGINLMEDDDMDEDMRLAIQMSMADAAASNAESGIKDQSSSNLKPDIANLVGDLPGLDKDDARVQKALDDAQKNEKDEDNAK